MTKTEIMKEAHRIAREELEGDYQAKLSLALKMVWNKIKGGSKMKIDAEKGKVVEASDEMMKLIDTMSENEEHKFTHHIINSELKWGDYSGEKELVVDEKEIPSSLAKEMLENAKEELENKKIKKQRKQKARETGEEQFYYSYNETCNDPKAECNLDLINVYIQPDGSTREKRIHTY